MLILPLYEIHLILKGSVMMGILTGNPEDEPLDYGEVFERLDKFWPLGTV